MVESSRAFLRHAVATVAYRGGKTLRGAPATFADFSIGPAGRPASRILSHIGDLFDWALSMARGKQVWKDSTPLPWSDEVARFHGALAAFDAYLASDAPLHAPVERLLQGPVADALTHVGQLAMMRRASGSPMRGENYFVAGIAAGQVGPDQPVPVKEFD